MNIIGIPKPELLSALHHRARRTFLFLQPFGFLTSRKEPLTIEEAKQIIERRKAHGASLQFDTLNGRSLQIDITQDDFNPDAYDRENGRGAAREVVIELRRHFF
jgi:hypothetical protein